jgi:hypothetical protein
MEQVLAEIATASVLHCTRTRVLANRERGYERFVDECSKQIVLVFLQSPDTSLRRTLYEGGFHRLKEGAALAGDVWVTADDSVGRFYTGVIEAKVLGRNDSAS